MTSPNYVAYAPGVVFVDDVGGSGGTPFVATNFNGLRNDLATYIQNHINGTANNHATGDLIDVQMPETTAYANAATLYFQSARNDMFALLFKQMLGGTGNLTARIATFLANSGSDLNTLFTTVGGATTAGAANALVKTTGTGGIVASGAVTGANFVATAPNTATAPVNVRAFSATAQPLWTGQSGGGSPAITSIINSDGTATLTTLGLKSTNIIPPDATTVPVNVAAFSATRQALWQGSAGGGGATSVIYSDGTIVATGPGFQGSAALLTPRTMPWGVIGAGALSGTGASNTLTVALGFSFPNSAGILKTVAAGATVALTAPTTGNQWAVIWWNDAGTANITYGTVGGTRDTAVMPTDGTGHNPLWVSMPQNCIGIYSSVADYTAAGSPANKGYVDDRPVQAGIGGGSGGGGTPFTIAPTAGQATLARALNQFVSPNVMLSLQASGAALQLTVSNGPIECGINTIWNEIAVALTTGNTAGAAGMYKLVVTLNAAGATPTLRLTQGSLVANEIELANCWFDGSIWQLYIVYWPCTQQLTVNGLPGVDAGFAQRWTAGAVTTATLTALPSSPSISLYFPIPLRLRAHFSSVVVPSVSTTSRIELALNLDSAAAGDTAISEAQTASSNNTLSGFYETPSPLAAGLHIFGLYGRAFNNSTFAAVSATFNAVNLVGRVMR